MEHTADFTVAALQADGHPGLPRGPVLHDPERQLVGGRGVQRAALPDRIGDRRRPLRLSYLPQPRAARRCSSQRRSSCPIVANWLRAYMIVMIGHLSSMKYAVGRRSPDLRLGVLRRRDADPVLGRVVLARGPEAPAAPAAATATADRGRARGWRRSRGVAAAVAVLTAAWPLAAHRLGTGELSPPDAPGAGWAGGLDGGRSVIRWVSPNFLGRTYDVGQAYARSEARAGIHLSYYRDQRPGAQLISCATRSSQRPTGDHGGTRAIQ